MVARVAPVVLFLTTFGVAQDEARPTSNLDIVRGVLDGGRFEESKWRRGADGALEVHSFADLGLEIEGERFRPMLGEDAVLGLRNAGPVGLFAMACHGPADLLAMTDAEFHLSALGVDTTDVGLRQFLVTPMPAFDGQRGRAELFDRLLAIDLLVRRGCRSARAELTAVTRGEQPEVLKTRARVAQARLEGRPDPTPRRRLAAETLLLPLVFDACVVVDHSRLPDLGWVTAFGRRYAATRAARLILDAGGEVSKAVLNGAQSAADSVGELPFGLALRYGNGRVDHSCFVLTAIAARDLRVALSWQAVGEFDAERWQRAPVAEAFRRNSPLRNGRVEIAAGRVVAALGGGAGKPRPEQARELLRDSGAAIRVVVPAASRLWPALRAFGLPAAVGGEVRLRFGDPATVTIELHARDEDDAEEWVERGRALLSAGREYLDELLPSELVASRGVADLMRQVGETAIRADGSTVTAISTLTGVTPEVLQSLAVGIATAAF